MNPTQTSSSNPSSSLSSEETNVRGSSGISIERVFTTPGSDPLDQVQYEKRTSRIANTDGSVVFEMEGAEGGAHGTRGPFVPGQARSLDSASRPGVGQKIFGATGAL